MASGVILLVEDEQSISSLVELYLRKEGFEVEVCEDGALALDRIERLAPSLVVLDIMLPGMDGIEICRRLRASSSVPVIMLTARDADVDRIVGLELGADDYLTKPFNPRELVARVKAVLRRAPSLAAASDETLRLGELTVDTARHLVTGSSGQVELTAKEFDLLAHLVRNRGIVFSRDRLLETVWGYERVVDTRTIDSHVRSLRAKLGADGSIIKTLRGVGYKAEA
ncbi:MAG: response regulator [Actinomycetota bacterium]